MRSILYNLGVVAAGKVMLLASLLIYSRYLQADEYGLMSLFFSYNWLLGIFVTANMHTAVGRFIYDHTYSINELIGTTLCAIGVPLTVTVFFSIFQAPFVSDILNLPISTLPLLFSVVIGQVSESLLLQIFTARGKSGLLFAIIASRAIAGVVGSVILFNIFISDRYLAVLYTEAATGLILAGYVLLYLWGDRPWKFSLIVLKSFTSYSLPLIPYMLSLTLIVQVDRIMIDRIFNKELTGIYSIGFNLGMILVLVANGLLNALNPRFFSAMNEKRYDEMRLDASIVLSVCALGAVAMILFGPYAASLAIPARYSDGFKLIPLVSLGAFVSSAFQIWGRLIGYARKTYLLAIVAVGATFIKIVLNFILFKKFGIIVGPLTTIAAYALMASSVAIIINADSDFPQVDWTRAFRLFCILAGAVFLQQSASIDRLYFWIYGLIALIFIMGVVLRDALSIDRKFSKERML